MRLGKIKVSNAFELPTTDGSAEQVIKTTGSGTCSWGAGSGTTKNVVQSNSFSVGEILRHNGTSYVKAQANSAENSEAIGIVSAASGSSFTLMTGGYISGLTGLTAGTVYFLSDGTAGALTSTEPTYSKPLLIADSTTSGFFYNFRGLYGGGDAGLGTWESGKSVNTTYQASTDGFVLAMNSSQNYIYCDTDSSSPPTTTRTQASGTSVGGYQGLCCPVRKGDYWKITTSGTATIFWIPFSGVGGGGGGEDTIARGFELVYNSTTSVDVNPGVMSHGTSRVAKTAVTTLAIGTAADWYDGSTHSYSGGAGWCYIGVDSSGNIKFLHTNAPDKADTSGNTAGTKYYWYYTTGGKYYRVIGRVRVNTSDNIIYEWYQRGDTIWYKDIKDFAGPFNTHAYTERDITSVTSAIDSEALTCARQESTIPCQISIRDAKTADSGGYEGFTIEQSNNQYNVMGGWMPIYDGPTYTRAFYTRQLAGAGSGYASIKAVRLSIR